MSTPLKPPPPYCTERPFHSTGRLTWNLIGGALGSVGSIWPSTLQKAGLAGGARPDGVGPRSATASGDGASNVAESIFTASAPPVRPLQTVSASSASVIASALSALMAAIAPTSHAQSFALFRVIVSTQRSLFSRIGQLATLNATFVVPSIVHVRILLRTIPARCPTRSRPPAPAATTRYRPSRCRNSCRDGSGRRSQAG